MFGEALVPESARPTSHVKSIVELEKAALSHMSAPKWAEKSVWLIVFPAHTHSNVHRLVGPK